MAGPRQNEYWKAKKVGKGKAEVDSAPPFERRPIQREEFDDTFSDIEEIIRRQYPELLGEPEVVSREQTRMPPPPPALLKPVSQESGTNGSRVEEKPLKRKASFQVQQTQGGKRLKESPTEASLMEAFPFEEDGERHHQPNFSEKISPGYEGLLYHICVGGDCNQPGLCIWEIGE